MEQRISFFFFFWWSPFLYHTVYAWAFSYVITHVSEIFNQDHSDLDMSCLSYNTSDSNDGIQPEFLQIQCFISCFKSDELKLVVTE